MTMKSTILFIFSLLLLFSPDSAPAQPRFPFQYRLESRRIDTVATPIPTSTRHRYRITAWGTYSMWEDTLNSSVDPMWIYSFPAEEWAKPEWRIFTEGYPIYVGDPRLGDIVRGESSHGLRINNLPMPKQPLSDAHRYSFIIQGNGRPVTASIVDWNFDLKTFARRDAHGNNSGSLTVLIEELPISTLEICAIDSSAFPVIRVSVKAYQDSVRYEDLAGRILIQEAGWEVPVDSAHCAETAVGASVSMVFDRSGSMREPFGTGTRITAVRAAGRRFVDRLSAIDEATIYSFSDNTRLDQGWTSSKPLLKSAIDRLEPEGWTAMNDAVLTALDDIVRRPAARRKALVVLSDGEDNWSAVRSIQTVINRAKSAGVPVFAIGLLLDGDDSLRMLAERTGGRYFSVSDPAAFDSVFASIATLVLEPGCCSIYYTSPDRRRNGSFRPVTAAWVIPDDTTMVRSTGYHAPGGVSRVEDARGELGILDVRPNPIVGHGSVRIRIAHDENIMVSLVDTRGEVVRELYSGRMSAGERQIEIPAEGLAAGRYFLRISRSGETIIHPLVVQ
jgi:VWFA-related protein